MDQRGILITGAVIALLSVVFGAFGAHALKPVLEHAGRFDTFELAVRYQFFHALAMLITGVTMNRFRSKHITRAAWCFLAGILLFSGSLYVLCFTGLGALGAITPVGGLFFIAGWLLLVLGFIKN